MTYPNKPTSITAFRPLETGKSEKINNIISAIGIDNILAINPDGTYKNNFSIGDNTLNALVNEINIRQGSTIKEYDSTGANLLRTLTLGSATNLAQGFRYLDDPIKISNNPTNPSTEIDVSAGIMTFDDGTGQVRLATSLTKSTANDFANGGLLPNGTVLQTNTWYYVFAIYSTASNLVNFYADTSKTSPTLPTSPNVYDKKQYRGAFYVDASGNIIEFQQLGRNYFAYKNRFAEYSANIGTGQVSINCSYQPLEIETLSHFRANLTETNTNVSIRLELRPAWQGNIPVVNIGNHLIGTGTDGDDIGRPIRSQVDYFAPFTAGSKTIYGKTDNNGTNEFRLISLGYHDLSLKD